MRVKSLLAACATVALTGCATQVIGTITLSNISSIAGIASTLATGQDLGEHALSLIMGKDCRFSEALVTEDRDICEEHGSPRTKNDFQGILIAGKDAEGNVVRGAPNMMSASEGSIEDGDVSQVWAKIHSAQQTQFAEAETRVAARTRQANDALLAFASTGPGTFSTPAPMTVAENTTEYKSVISGPVVVLRLAPLQAQAPVAVAQAEEPAPIETASVEAAPIQVVSVTPVRKPASLQMASAEPAEEIEVAAAPARVSAPAPTPVVAAVATVVAPTPAPAPKAEVQVADASPLSGTRLIVPLRKAAVTLVNATTSDAGASVFQPVATVASVPTPYVMGE